MRINAWLKKLRDEVSSNVTWQRNRNCYARLLLEQVSNNMAEELQQRWLHIQAAVHGCSTPKAQQGSSSMPVA